MATREAGDAGTTGPRRLGELLVADRTLILTLFLLLHVTHRSLHVSACFPFCFLGSITVKSRTLPTDWTEKERYDFVSVAERGAFEHFAMFAHIAIGLQQFYHNSEFLRTPLVQPQS